MKMKVESTQGCIAHLLYWIASDVQVYLMNKLVYGY